MKSLRFEELLREQPAEWPESLLGRIRSRLVGSSDRLVILDDDPTGTQTVSGVEVVMDWSLETLDRAVRESVAFFVLTNSRSMTEATAIAVNAQIGSRLAEVASRAGARLRLASRSDSTLRGHFPAEVEALVRGAGVRPHACLLVPSFPEGGRFTVGNIHWVRDGLTVVPVAETAYARDPVFGYTNSQLPKWVEEKSGGRIRADDVMSLSLAAIRTGGPDAVADLLRKVPFGSVVVVNAVAQSDLEVVADGVQEVEQAGLDIVYRSAASFVRVRAGIAQRPLLSRREVFEDAPSQGGPGLIVCGSHVSLSTAQVAEACCLPNVAAIEVPVNELYPRGPARITAVERAAVAASSAIEAGRHALVFTTREYRALDPAQPLEASQSIAEALAEVVRHVSARPGFVVGKGGITSSVLATNALGLKRALVLGQVAAGVSVWTSDSGRLPRVPFVVFPGNVGSEHSLAEVLNLLSEG